MRIDVTDKIYIEVQEHQWILGEYRISKKSGKRYDHPRTFHSRMDTLFDAYLRLYLSEKKTTANVPQAIELLKEAYENLQEKAFKKLSGHLYPPAQEKRAATRF